VLQSYGDFDLVIYIGELCKYRDVVKKVAPSIVKLVDGKSQSPLAKGTQIGYVAAGSIKLYSPPGWIEVSKVSMNRFKVFTENNILIGYFEQAPDESIRFKIRSPMHIAEQKPGAKQDLRFMERGIVCSTKSKSDLNRIADDIRVRDASSKVKTICEQIRDRLVELEMREREKDSKIKYLYLSHEL
jgi:hypothetical protein